MMPSMYQSPGPAPAVDAVPVVSVRSAFVVDGRVPPAVVRGEGCRVLDELGRWLIDANNNFTVLIHGHGHPKVMDALESVLRDGTTSFGLPSSPERELATLIASRVASVDQVQFTNSGTEAVQTAIRLARATTGRSTVIGIAGAFHGSSDAALAIHGADYMAGVPDAVAAEVRCVPLNDIGALEAAVDASGDDLALVLFDLMANYTGLRRLSDEFVATARSLCDERGALLAFDEVVSLRHHVGGMQALYDVHPDLTTMGKIIGGGMPIGAVGGSAAAMALLDASRGGSVFASGTFSGNPLSTAAGLACLAELDTEAITRLNALGDRLRERLSGLVPHGWEIRGHGSLTRVIRPGGRPTPPSFFWKALDRGVLVTPGALVVLSTPMDEAVIDEIAASLGLVAREVDEEPA